MENRRIKNTTNVKDSTEIIKEEYPKVNIVNDEEKTVEGEKNFGKNVTEERKIESLQNINTVSNSKCKYSKNVSIEKIDECIKINNELIRIDRIEKIDVQEDIAQKVEPEQKALSYLLIPVITGFVFGIILIILLRFARINFALTRLLSILRFLTLASIIASIVYLAYIVKEKMMQVETYKKIFIKFTFKDNSEKELILFNNEKHIVKDDNYKKVHLMAKEIIERINDIL